MKVLHISALQKGGAAKAAIRLHLGLLKLGVDSKMLILNYNDETIPQSIPFYPKYTDIPKAPFISRIRNKLHRIGKEFNLNLFVPKKNLVHLDYLQGSPKDNEKFSSATTEWDITKDPSYLDADIINLHWVAGFVDYASFFEKNTKPIIWTLHDLNPFTGGCHYPAGCEKFKSDCSNCHQLKGTIDNNYSKNQLNIKINSLQLSNNLFIVSPSKWLMRLSQSSALFSKLPHFYIPNGVDTDVFKPLFKRSCRELLSLPQDKNILLFVAESIENKRKGFSLLIKALDLIKSENILLCSIGKSSFELNLLPNHINLGIIHDELLMSIIYNSADIFIIPSLEDNLPNTMLEAISCEIPIIGFGVGGIEETLLEYCPDNISKTKCDELANRILSSLSNNCPPCNSIREKYSLLKQAEDYKNLYAQVLLS